MSLKVEEGGATEPKKKHFAPPQVSSDELLSFHEAHFGGAALGKFSHTFLNPAAGPQADEADEEWEDEEDDLGYYDDGVKRTLTDDQIAMFRHSELKELRRAQEKLALKRQKRSGDALDEPHKDSDGAPPEESSLPSRFTSTKKRKKAHRPKEPKPDLRKRTWDVVDKGLDTLDYD